MLLFKIYAVALIVAAANADKKIELEDIEEDNLKSERQKEYEKERPQGPSAVSAPDLGYLKNNFIQYYDAPSPTTQHPRYVQQYAVTESPEAPTKPQYDQHQPVGYISNVPMLYIVPQYYNEQIPQAQTHGAQYAPSAPQNSYPNTPEQQQQQNYVVPTFITPTGNAQLPRFIQPYTTPVAFIGYPQPTLPPPQPSASPPQSYQTYQSPVANYHTALAAPPYKNYQQTNQYSNSIDQNHGQAFSSQGEGPYVYPHQEYPRYYNSRAPVRDEYRTSIELPHPSPLLLKPSPPHLSHIPKALPTYRPLSKPIYATSGPLISSAFTPKPAESYGVPFKRRPSSLLESYIPSNVQLEYLKRGYTKDALSTYEALSSDRGFPQVYPTPRYYERGFLPNQMYHTAAGGVTFGQHKRAPKIVK